MSENQTNPPGQPNAPAPNPQPPQPVIRPVSLVFVGPIQNPASKNLRNICCSVVTSGTKDIQILFSSSGGLVDEGFALYNFLRALPVNLTMHAIGYVDSMALVVFLAGQVRYCSPDSTFLFHDFAWGAPGAVNQTRSQWADLNESLNRTTVRSKELLKLRTTFTDKDFEALKLYEKATIQGAGFAKEKGIVNDIKEAAIPAGALIANVDF
jgi:ATP-dependent Clp protease protease subunit